MVSSMINALGSLFYPCHCAGCGKELSLLNQTVCVRCQALLPETNFIKFPENPVEKLFAGRLWFRAAYSQYYFSRSTIIQSIIHELKYKGNSNLGVDMGKLMGHIIKHSERFSNIDCIIPLPLFPEKERARGYNQAELLARGINDILKIAVLTEIVIKTRPTSTQTKKNRMERWQNVNDVFSVTHPEILKGKKVLLIDDVITTGATLEACGNSIIKAGCSDLFLASLAFAMQ